MYNFALKRHHLPPYAENPFSELPLERFEIEDAKPIFVFDAKTEVAFLRAANHWAFPIRFTPAKTGVRIGELVHLLIEDVRAMERLCEERRRDAGAEPSRAEVLTIARGVWRDAGAIKPDRIRTSFFRIMKAINHPEASCPKSWRHSFATLLQDANVDPLIRQQTLGHRPTTGEGLGITANYTHTRRETQRQQIEQALRRWPESLRLALEFATRE